MNLYTNELDYIIYNLPHTVTGTNLSNKLRELIPSNSGKEYQVLYRRDVGGQPVVSTSYHISLSEFKIKYPTVIGLQLLESTGRDRRLICYNLVPEYK